MKGLALMLVKILMIILAILGILYFINFPITEVAGEKIGFADMLNFLLLQIPPNLPERSVESNAEMTAWASEIDGSDLGVAAGIVSGLGNPVTFCVFKDYSYCQNFRIEGTRIYETNEAAQKKVYISYGLAVELRGMAETGNTENLDKRLMQGVKSGEVKGLTISDVMGIGK
jgi:hypothetical protein